MKKQENNTQNIILQEATNPKVVLKKYIYQTQFFRKPTIYQFVLTSKIIILCIIALYVSVKLTPTYRIFLFIGVAIMIINAYKKSFFTFTFKILREKSLYNIISFITKKYFNERKQSFSKEKILAEYILCDEYSKKKKHKKNKKEAKKK